MKRFHTAFQCVLAALVLLLTSALVAPLLGMSLAYSAPTNSDINKIWRKSQGKLMNGFNFKTPEFRMVKQFKELQIDSSLREMTFPVDLNEDDNITMLSEGGRRAHPSTVNAVDATVQFVHANGRISASFLAKWAGMADGGRGMIAKEIVYKGKKKVEAMARNLGNQFYGFSTGVLAVVDDSGGSLTSGSSHTITLKNGLGSSLIAGTTTAQKKYIANLFKVGGHVALIDGNGDLVTNAAFGAITAVNASTPSITVSWPNGNVDPDDDDEIVLSNGANGTTIAHTSYNKALSGLLEFLTSTSVHGISSSSEPNWDVSFEDTTTGGRYNGQRWRKAVDEMRNFGDEEATPKTLFAQGVYRDVLAQYQAGVRYNDPFDLEIDGDIKGKGKAFRSSRRVPPGMVILFDDSKGAIRKKTIHDEVESPGWADGQPQIDDAFWTFDIDWAGFLCTTNRKLFAYEAGLTEI